MAPLKRGIFVSKKLHGILLRVTFFVIPDACPRLMGMIGNLLLIAYNLFHDGAGCQEFGQHDLLACIAGGVNGVRGDS